jgi:transposase-like protein
LDLSYPDVEELLVERVEVDHLTVFRWVQAVRAFVRRRGPFARHAPGEHWFADETYLRDNGVWHYVYRAIDQYGQVVDVLGSAGAMPSRPADSSKELSRRSR